MQECGLEPLQINWFRATVRLNNSLIQCKTTNASTKVFLNNSLIQCKTTNASTKVLHADMQLSSRYNDCCFSHIFSAMADLIQGCTFKEKLQNCESIDLCKLCKPCKSIDLNHFCGHLEFWTPYSDACPHICISIRWQNDDALSIEHDETRKGQTLASGVC
jgi:hypothetical protein